MKYQKYSLISIEKAAQKDLRLDITVDRKKIFKKRITKLSNSKVDLKGEVH